jgi:hypothetical protein
MTEGTSEPHTRLAYMREMNIRGWLEYQTSQPGIALGQTSLTAASLSKF